MRASNTPLEDTIAQVTQWKFDILGEKHGL